MKQMKAPRPHALSLALALALLCAQTLLPAAAAQSSSFDAARRPSSGQLPVQTPERREPQRPATSPEEEDEVVRINTSLVQIDAVVTDEQGRQVTDLTAEDFEIIEEGQRREITNFSFIGQGTPLPAPSSSNAAGPRVAPARLRPEHLRRTIVLVVDDLTMSFANAVFARRAMRKFVEEHVGPGDLVAVVRVSAGVGALQQLTSDKEQLYAAIGRVRSRSRCQNSIFAFDAPQPGASGGGAAGAAAGPLSVAEGGPREGGGAFGDQMFATGVLGAINLIVRGLRELPGRKAVVLFSEGYSNCEKDPAEFAVKYSASMERLADLANRASVVFYSIDTRGLMTLDPDPAEPPIRTSNPAAYVAQLRARSQYIYHSQGAWLSLTEPTGGFAIYNNNDLAGGLRRIADEQKGYYLIGYRPDEATFKPERGGPRFRGLTVRVKRPKLKVRTRRGFFNVTDEQTRPAQPKTRREQLLAGLASPFSSGEIDVRLTSLFGSEAGNSFVLSMLHIDPRGLTFTAQPDGWRQAEFDILAVTFDADGRIVEQVGRTQTIRARGATLQRIMKNGLVYSLSVPAKKPGGYQLRIALRDAASERVGSAGQFVEVPDLGKGWLTLSGLTVSGADEETADGPGPSAASGPSTAAADADSPAVKEEVEYDPDAGPALRRFRQGSVLEYGYSVYNPRLDKATGRPRVRAQVALFRDGQQVFAGQPQQLEVEGRLDSRRLDGGGRLQLGSAFPPGEYVLQVVVTDELAGGARRTAVRWTDFEVRD